MRHSLSRIALIAVLAGVPACGPTESELDVSRVHSDSGVRGPGYDTILAKMDDLATRYSHASVVRYGNSVAGRDLAYLRIQTQPNAKGPVVLIAGTIHGDEYLGIEEKLPEFFLSQASSGGIGSFLSKGGIVLMIPILNPDGYTARRRENDRGQDLNRDFHLKKLGHQGFRHPETKTLYTAIEEVLKADGLNLSMTLDYHCCQGSLIYPWGHSRTEQLPDPIKKEHLRIGSLMLSGFPGYKKGRAFDLLQYTAVGASDDFYHETFGSTSFTFEGAYRGEQLARHEAMWDRVMADQAALISDTGGALSQPPVSDLFLSLTESTTIALAGPSQSAEMLLCQGDRTTCLGGNPKQVASSVKFTDKNGIRVFAAEPAESLQLMTTYTILAKDSQGQVIGTRSIRFESL